MFGWIRREYDRVTGIVDSTIQRWVHDLINGLYGFLHNIFGLVGAGWDELLAATHVGWAVLHEFVSTASNIFAILYHVTIPNIIHAIEHDFTVALNFAKSVLAALNREITRVILIIGNAVAAVRRWVITDIWNPIWRILDQAWHWITHEGDTIWHYITHAADLVDLLWDALIAKIEHEAWTVADKLGKFALSLVAKNLLQFVKLVEDIIDAIL